MLELFCDGDADAAELLVVGDVDAAPVVDEVPAVVEGSGLAWIKNFGDVNPLTELPSPLIRSCSDESELLSTQKKN